MPNQQLIDYIKQQLERDIPPNSIKEVLSKVGWNENDIAQAFANLNRMPIQAKKIMPQINNISNQINNTNNQERVAKERVVQERIIVEQKPKYSNQILYKPMGVEFISVLYFIMSLLILSFSGLAFFGIKYLNAVIGIDFSEYSSVAGTIGLFIGIIGIFMSIELWKLRNWARILTIFISVIIAGLTIAYISKDLTNITNSLISNTVGLIVNFIIIFYLLLSNRVKEVFR